VPTPDPNLIIVPAGVRTDIFSKCRVLETSLDFGTTAGNFSLGGGIKEHTGSNLTGEHIYRSASAWNTQYWIYSTVSITVKKLFQE
jgi:hypothetical protein